MNTTWIIVILSIVAAAMTFMYFRERYFAKEGWKRADTRAKAIQILEKEKLELKRTVSKQGHKNADISEINRSMMRTVRLWDAVSPSAQARAEVKVVADEAREEEEARVRAIARREEEAREAEAKAAREAERRKADARRRTTSRRSSSSSSDTSLFDGAVIAASFDASSCSSGGGDCG